MSIKWCTKQNIKYSNKYVLSDKLNGNKYSIKKCIKACVKFVVNWVLNGNKYRLNGNKRD